MQQTVRRWVLALATGFAACNGLAAEPAGPALELNRLQAMEARGPGGSDSQVGGAIALVGGAGTMQGGPQVSDADAYQAAFDELRDGRYPQAAEGFRLFLADYPDSDLRDNAQYWLAESYYVQKDFDGALRGFQTVIADYPASRKIADAWLKVGYCNYELERWPEARQALTTAANQFPDSTASKLAKERLQQAYEHGQTTPRRAGR